MTDRTDTLDKFETMGIKRYTVCGVDVDIVSDIGVDGYVFGSAETDKSVIVCFDLLDKEEADKVIDEGIIYSVHFHLSYSLFGRSGEEKSDYIHRLMINN